MQHIEIDVFFNDTDAKFSLVKINAFMVESPALLQKWEMVDDTYRWDGPVAARRPPVDLSCWNRL